MLYLWSVQYRNNDSDDEYTCNTRSVIFISSFKCLVGRTTATPAWVVPVGVVVLIIMIITAQNSFVLPHQKNHYSLLETIVTVTTTSSEHDPYTFKHAG